MDINSTSDEIIRVDLAAGDLTVANSESATNVNLNNFPLDELNKLEKFVITAKYLIECKAAEKTQVD